MSNRIRRRDRICPAPGMRAMTGTYPAIAAATARVRQPHAGTPSSSATSSGSCGAARNVRIHTTGVKLIHHPVVGGP
jgi:hypothetical protein